MSYSQLNLQQNKHELRQEPSERAHTHKNTSLNKGLKAKEALTFCLRDIYHFL